MITSYFTSPKLNSGFESVNEELILHGKYFGNGDGLAQLQQMLSTFIETKDNELSSSLVNRYKSYKESFVKHLLFNVSQPNLSKLLWLRHSYLYILISAATIEHAPLEAVYIFFNTATYDEIERNVKVTRVSSNAPRNCLGTWAIALTVSE